MNTVGVAYGEYSVLQANLLKIDLCEQTNCRDESQIVFHAARFLDERSRVRTEEVHLSQNRLCLFLA
jgi:hypothetical protein